MRKLIMVLLALAFVQLLTAQAQSSPQEEIDRDVWHPFIQAYAASDAEGFLALHAEEAIRVVRDGKKITRGKGYRQEVRTNMATSRERGGRQTIELRFTERFAKGDLAFNSGYYKVVTTFSEDETYTFYGQFDVVLQKNGERWEILVDADSSHGGTINERDFLKGKKVGEY